MDGEITKGATGLDNRTALIRFRRILLALASLNLARAAYIALDAAPSHLPFDWLLSSCYQPECFDCYRIGVYIAGAKGRHRKET